MKQFSFLFVLLLLACAASCPARTKTKCESTAFAHRGCHLGNDIPENSLRAVEMARRYGYDVIECDVHYTKDSVMVLMHDYNDMRRCIRHKDNRPVENRLRLADITFSELRREYVLASEKEEERVPVPTLEEMLAFCKQYEIVPMLHSDIVASYEMAQRVLGNKWIAFCSSLPTLQAARRMSDVLILLNQGSGTAAEAISKLKQIGGHCGISSMNYRMMTGPFCDSLRQAGYEVQSSIFPVPYDGEAIHHRASILLSDFCYLPNGNKRPNGVLTLKKQRMEAGQSMEMVGAQSTYGAQVLELQFQGTVEVTLGGKNRYTLTRSTFGTEYLGLRFYEDRPSVKLTAKTPVKLGKSRLFTYTF
ncbi:MAG: glycerophosphodiester phosphodiesterase family protein [Bacteroidaceae bacterium]|nr:glycerophosphodiester phosphodiesterase family protein [Bacteroidaceae bacterium]